ncbi:FliI/YscN family ATPase (plasmid) [Pontibacillus sp. ALD_SL1]|uniref:FliI/YscN family ATPase n=1 Tax=Pontibacillus sp. ALD_SL1 TaxID=2777185 RepID=UPI001A96747C|nr:FliI/YscN family ATPase [Pontibacillus sp. ALD_SL1]QST03035.1 FliI/YscN family ATPase [Pontibacillus sp. ALD_SL1]
MFDLSKYTGHGRAPFLSFGEVISNNGTTICSKGPRSRVGDVVEVGKGKSLCEVISVSSNLITMTPYSFTRSIEVGDRVVKKERGLRMKHPSAFVGKVINGFGESLEGDYDIPYEEKVELSLYGAIPNALHRRRIQTPFETGVKAIDATLTMGEGQRIGIFAGTGVGKTTLLSMIARNAASDINVIALIGERGREVREFIEKNLGEEGMKRSILVVSTSDEGALMHIRASQLAMSIAEYFRDQGQNVLFMMDSISRFAMAKREVDIARGEMPLGGKTPSMEPAMQRLLERAGTSDRGVITGIFTVLVEGDDFEGVIPDTARGILDGHIVLDRKLAAHNHFPAINVLDSISRVMEDVSDEKHWAMNRVFRKYYALYKQNEDSFMFGAYQQGRNQELDMAYLLYPKLSKFLQQDVTETYAFKDSLEQLEEVLK